LALPQSTDLPEPVVTPEIAQNTDTNSTLPDLIVNILPTNPTASIAQGDMLAVVVLALLVGVSVTQVQDRRAEPFLLLMEALLSISMNIVKWAMFLAPLAVFGLMAQLVMRVGVDTLLGVAGYVGTVLLGLAGLLVFYVFVAGIFGQVGPRRFLKTAGSNLLLAFSTSSSSAVMPITIQTAREFGVPPNIANLVVPLGATMNMAGTALYQAVAILFLAQLSGVELTGAQIAVVVGNLVFSSIGAPGTPGVSIAILINVATSMGIPVEGMVIIFGVDRLLDMCRTVVNVTGDLVASMLLRNTAQDEAV
jgi:Na+/H+-dicarboxylate symporter